MAGETTRIMLLPRYSSLVGATNFETTPHTARAFSEVSLTRWRGAGNGVSGLSVAVELSADLRYWVQDNSWSLAADDETTHTSPLNREWMRLVITLTGTDPAVPLWILGEFLRRES